MFYHMFYWTSTASEEDGKYFFKWMGSTSSNEWEVLLQMNWWHISDGRITICIWGDRNGWRFFERQTWRQNSRPKKPLFSTQCCLEIPQFRYSTSHSNRNLDPPTKKEWRPYDWNSFMDEWVSISGCKVMLPPPSNCNAYAYSAWSNSSKLDSEKSTWLFHSCSKTKVQLQQFRLLFWEWKFQNE